MIFALLLPPLPGGGRSPGSERRQQDPAAPARSGWRAALRGVRVVATVAFVVAWVLLLRPQALGGPATWVLVSGNSMQPGLHDGDLVLTQRRSEYRHGDVIAYRIPRGDLGAGNLVIHRLVGGDRRTGFRTQGDNRARPDLWRPSEADVAGSVVASVPAVGSVLGLLRTPLVLAVLSALTAFLIIPRPRRPR